MCSAHVTQEISLQDLQKKLEPKLKHWLLPSKLSASTSGNEAKLEKNQQETAICKILESRLDCTHSHPCTFSILCLSELDWNPKVVQILKIFIFMDSNVWRAKNVHLAHFCVFLLINTFQIPRGLAKAVFLLFVVNFYYAHHPIPSSAHLYWFWRFHCYEIVKLRNVFFMILYFTLAAREQNLSKMPPQVCFVGQL